MSDPFELDTNPFVGESFGWIQWKGTNVCMDVHCKYCGEEHLLGHIDAEFAYFLHCTNCDTCYLVSAYVRLIPVSKEDTKGGSEPVEVEMD